MVRSPVSRHRGTLPAALLTCLLAAAIVPAGADGETLREALSTGKVTLDLRYRYEDVRDDAVGEKHARASTLRTALGYRTRLYRGFSFELEAESVAVLGNELFANRGAGSRDNGVSDRPLVADVAGTEIQQAVLRYLGNRWRLAAGRQELRLGDERFVGNVGWRQNRQSFDALRVDSSLGGLRFSYFLIDRVNRISGGSQELAAHLLNVGFDLQNVGRFTLYGYLLDYREPAASGLSTATWGLEFAGKRRRLRGGSWLYEVEHARQSDHADNPSRIDVGYSFLMAGAALPRLTLKLAWERLEGSADDGQLRTPLATLHRHNGWADRFLVTPTEGLEDLSLQLGGRLGQIGWLLRHHDFAAASSSRSYGRELDLELTWASQQGVELGLKGALYEADGFAADTRKWMLWASWGL